MLMNACHKLQRGETSAGQAHIQARTLSLCFAEVAADPSAVQLPSACAQHARRKTSRCDCCSLRVLGCPSWVPENGWKENDNALCRLSQALLRPVVWVPSTCSPLILSGSLVLVSVSDVCVSVMSLQNSSSRNYESLMCPNVERRTYSAKEATGIEQTDMIIRGFNTAFENATRTACEQHS